MRKNEPKNWDDLSDHDLKDAVRIAILGSGMAGATEYLSFKKSFYDHASQELQSRIKAVLIELMEEVEPRTVTVGGRAILISAEIQAPELVSKLEQIEKNINSHLGYIESAEDLDSCIGLFEYIADFNASAGKLLLVSAKPILSLQVSKYTQQNPKPLTKEYYLHYMCSKSAMAALERIASAST